MQFLIAQWLHWLQLFFSRKAVADRLQYMYDWGFTVTRSVDWRQNPQRLQGGHLGHISAPAWWRHQMEAFSASLAICAGNSPVTGEFPAQRPVTQSFDVFFDLRLNKRLSKQSWGWWLRGYRAHYDVSVMWTQKAVSALLCSVHTELITFICWFRCRHLEARFSRKSLDRWNMMITCSNTIKDSLARRLFCRRTEFSCNLAHSEASCSRMIAF